MPSLLVRVSLLYGLPSNARYSFSVQVFNTVPSLGYVVGSMVRFFGALSIIRLTDFNNTNGTFPAQEFEERIDTLLYDFIIFYQYY